MRPTFDQWIRDSRYRGYDKTVHAMLREAYRAGGQSDELDRAAELLRRLEKVGSETEATQLTLDINAFLREVEG